MNEINELRERLAKAEAELAKLRAREAKQKPVAMVDANDDGYFAEILSDCSVSVGDMLYAFPPLTAAPAMWKQSFDQWWDTQGQYLRAGGGQYEKTFGYHAWEAAAALYAAPIPALAVPAVPAVPAAITDELAYQVLTMALRNGTREAFPDKLRKLFAVPAVSVCHMECDECAKAGKCLYSMQANKSPIPAPPTPFIPDDDTRRNDEAFAAQQAATAPSVPEEWREVMAELADDLAIEIDQDYPPERRVYPSEQRKYEGEMVIVHRARALLQSAGENHD